MKYYKIGLILLAIGVLIILTVVMVQKKAPKIGSKAFRETILVFREHPNTVIYGKYFTINLFEAIDSFGYLMKGKPYMPNPVNYLDTSLHITPWILPKPYTLFTIHSLVLELEDGRQIELLDEGPLLYDLPPMTQVKNLRYNGTRDYYIEEFGMTEEDYTFDYPNYIMNGNLWTNIVAIFPKIRQEVVGLNLTESPEKFKEVWVKLVMTYSFDDETEQHREQFLFYGKYGKDSGRLPPKPAYKPANDYMNELEQNRP